MEDGRRKRPICSDIRSDSQRCGEIEVGYSRRRRRLSDQQRGYLLGTVALRECVVIERHGAQGVPSYDSLARRYAIYCRTVQLTLKPDKRRTRLFCATQCL